MPSPPPGRKPRSFEGHKGRSVTETEAGSEAESGSDAGSPPSTGGRRTREAKARREKKAEDSPAAGAAASASEPAPAAERKPKKPRPRGPPPAAPGASTDGDDQPPPMPKKPSSKRRNKKKNRRRSQQHADAEGHAVKHGEHLPAEVDGVLVSRVLVIYTGGTIGMQEGPRGYEPAPGFLLETMKSLPQFWDMSQPVGVTPVTKLGRRVGYDIIEYEPLLDSCNMSVAEWARIADDVRANYDDWDAFVVLHGTDTMAFTASALSFALQGLSKTVIVTGSQIPLAEQRNDALGNLLGALTTAGHYCIPEVCVYFGSQLIRGNRCTKQSSTALDAFGSYNMKPLAQIGVGFSVDWDAVLLPSGNDLVVNSPRAWAREVTVLRIFPGMSNSVLRQMLAPPIRGCVLQTFGAGNGPDQDPEFLAAIREACDRGVVIVNITQCPAGGVESHYATGAALYNAGVVSGEDMTVEAALTKLMWLLSAHDVPRARELMSTPQRGELTVPDDQRRFGFSNSAVVGAVFEVIRKNQGMRSHQRGELTMLSQALGPVLLCSAAGNGHLDDVRAMIDAGADPSLGDYDRRTPMHLAASEGHLDVVQLLHASGANVNARDRWGGTPLEDARRHGHEEVVEFLQGRGALVFSNGERRGVLVTGPE